jgi:hypothetical protein
MDGTGGHGRAFAVMFLLQIDPLWCVAVDLSLLHTESRNDGCHGPLSEETGALVRTLWRHGVECAQSRTERLTATPAFRAESEWLSSAG